MRIRLLHIAHRTQQRLRSQQLFLRRQSCVSQDFLKVGDAHIAEGRFELAEACFVDALENIDVHESLQAVALQRLSSALLARAWMQNNDRPTLLSALNAADSALRKNRMDSSATICKAVALARLGNIDLALSELQGLFVRDDVARSPELSLHARALAVRFSSICRGSFWTIEQEVSEIRTALSLSESTTCSSPDEDNFGILRLEMELLACVAGVRNYDAGAQTDNIMRRLMDETRFDVHASMGKLADELDNDSSENGHTISDLHEFTLSLVLPEPEALCFPLDANNGDSDIGSLLLERLNIIVHRADVEDHYEILWQALSWRCRLHMLQQEWQSAASDASKALMLNVFAAAELQSPGIQSREGEVVVQSDVTPGPLSTPVGLSSAWSCLRMRMVALEMQGQDDAAWRDSVLLRKLQAPPPAIKMSTPKLVRSGEDDWRRSPEQVSRLKKRQQFRRTGWCSLPKGL